MQKLSSLIGRLAVVAAGALALGACNRGEYAMLPKSAAYLGTKTVASTPRPAATTPAQPEAVAAEAPVAVVPVAAVVPSAPASSPVVATTSTPKRAAAPVAAQRPAAAAESPATVKPTFGQQLVLKKINKKLAKLASKSPQFKQHDAAAETARVSGNLRTGLILLLIGLIVGLFNGLIGTIIALIGVVFLVLWLLDEL